MNVRPIAVALVGLACALSSAAFARKLPSFDAGSAAPSGVPSFVWATELDPLIGPLAKATTADPEAAARAFLRSAAPRYKMSASQVDGLVVSDVQRFPDGGSIARFGNRVDGIEVFRDQVNVLVDKSGALVAISGITSGASAAKRTFAETGVTSRDAAAVALAEHGFAAGVATRMHAQKEEGGYTWSTVEAARGDEATLASPVRAKRVWFRQGAALIPAWYVEVQVKDKGSRDIDAYSYVVSAVDGTVLFRNDLVSDAFSYRIYAETTPPFLPLPGPGGRAGFPHPTGTPDGYQPPFVAPNLVTLDSAPFSRNDPWLPGFATRTMGNNVEAFANKLEPDGYGPPGVDECNVALPVDGDQHACVTSGTTFDHVFNHALPANANRTQVAAAVTNLFYVVNFLHDWFYDAGFDEAAGNAQNSNFGRGGLGTDRIIAEVQDFSGSNNANMNTPADGAQPRMRMYLWSGSVAMAKVEAPPLGVKQSATGEFGAQAFDLTGNLVVARDAVNAEGPLDSDGCTAISNAGAIAGKIAVIDRGTCLFVVKVKNAQDAGAAGVIVVNNVSPGTITMSGEDASITIPALSITQQDGTAIKNALEQGTPIVLRMARKESLPRDSSFDNTVVAHEWGHYLSNRLISNANGLNANQGRGLGEGWGDFVALLTFVKEEDRNAPSNAGFGGTYAITPYPVGGPDFAPDVLNNAYYYGIRRYPYSRDLDKNPLTFRHIADGNPLPPSPPISPRSGGAPNSEVHATGEVWASMLWECYSNLLNDTGRLTFAQAQDRMKRYLVASLKMTPMDPTFVQARDAVLAVMQAQDAADADLCLTGFAKRGLGIGAVAPDRFSTDNAGVVESYSKTAGGGVKVVAVEYYHAAFDHYFVTSIADEIAKLDNGTFAGWQRTGELFYVYADVPPGSSPVCRFFSTAFGPKSSHFYTPDAPECATVKGNADWQFEGEVFSLPRPDANGGCATGVPVYRLYNNGQGGAPNHRYTTSLAMRTTMLNSGWIPEGSGALGVIMCSPA
jgi:hypothetical protein